MKKILFLLFLAVSVQGYSQKLFIDGFIGAAGYQGDMQNKYYDPAKMKMGGGLGMHYSYNGRIGGSFMVSALKVYGNDVETKLKRNLSFETKILEAKLLGEFNILDMEARNWSPYVAAGLAVFKFDPYTYTKTGEKVYLQPLGTEGQGLSQYPDKKMYKLTQMAIPFGGGIKVALSPKLQVGVEILMRKLLTDYLDDVSGNYADKNILIAERGQLAYELAYRASEKGLSDPYPPAGWQRGSPKSKDWYYTTGLRISYGLGGGGSDKHYGSGKRKGRMGCPGNVL